MRTSEIGLISWIVKSLEIKKTWDCEDDNICTLFYQVLNIQRHAEEHRHLTYCDISYEHEQSQYNQTHHKQSQYNQTHETQDSTR